MAGIGLPVWTQLLGEAKGDVGDGAITPRTQAGEPHSNGSGPVLGNGVPDRVEDIAFAKLRQEIAHELPDPWVALAGSEPLRTGSRMPDREH